MQGDDSSVWSVESPLVQLVPQPFYFQACPVHPVQRISSLSRICSLSSSISRLISAISASCNSKA